MSFKQLLEVQSSKQTYSNSKWNCLSLLFRPFTLNYLNSLYQAQAVSGRNDFLMSPAGSSVHVT